MIDWKNWHASYDDPDSSLARRLAVVRRYVSETLSARPAAAATGIVSLCSGDGRDLLPVLVEIGQKTAAAVLVEQDASLAQNARTAASKLGLDHVTVLTRDAGRTKHFAFALPVDLLLLCGIFGNVTEQDIALTVAATPTMLCPGGTVIWTRGSTKPDLRPTIRQWIKDAGLREIAFESEPEGFGVGMATRPPHLTADSALPARLFSFLR